MLNASSFASEGDFGAPAVAVPSAPQVGLDWGVGVGKTDRAIKGVAGVLVRDPEATIAIFVPDHAMAAEMEARCRGAMPGLAVEVYRGAGRPDPATSQGAPQPMCLRSKDVEAVQKAGGSITDVCGSKKRGWCPHSGTCGYRRQMSAIKNARIIILPHSMLSRPAPSFVPEPDFLFIDEAFHASMLGGPVKIPIAYIEPQTLAPIPDAGGLVGLDDRDTRRVVGSLRDLVARSAAHDRLSSGKLSAAGLSAAGLRKARVRLLRSKQDIPADQLPGTAPGAVGTLLGVAAAENERILRLAKALDVAEDILDGRLGGAGLRVDDKGALIVRSRDDMHADWLGAKHGILHADATMQPGIVRAFLPGLTLAPAPPIAAPHMRVFQVSDAVCGVSAFIAPSTSSAHAQSTAASKMRQLVRWLGALAEEYQGRGAPGGPDMLVVAPKKIEAVLVPHLPQNVSTLHYGKLRGQDAFKGVAVLVCVSWLMPPPQAVEDEAELIFGRDVSRRGAAQFYEKRDVPRAMASGTAHMAGAYFHPDPNAEAVLQSKCTAELMQAVGRGRGPRRTAANPLDVFILTSTPIAGLPVDRLVMWEDLMRDLIGPVREMQRAGVLPLDWPGREAVLAGLGLIKTAGGARHGDTLRKWFGENAEDAAMLRSALSAAQGNARVAEISLRDTLLREISATRTNSPPFGR
jgi:hypothetical protein